MYVEARASIGLDRFVTQLCPAVWSGVGPQRGSGQSPGSKCIFGNNLLKIGWKSGL